MLDWTTPTSSPRQDTKELWFAESFEAFRRAYREGIPAMPPALPWSFNSRKVTPYQNLVAAQDLG